MRMDDDNVRGLIEGLLFLVLFGVALIMIYLMLNCPSPTTLHC